MWPVTLLTPMVDSKWHRIVVQMKYSPSTCFRNRNYLFTFSLKMSFFHFSSLFLKIIFAKFKEGYSQTKQIVADLNNIICGQATPARACKLFFICCVAASISCSSCTTHPKFSSSSLSPPTGHLVYIIACCSLWKEPTLSVFTGCFRPTNNLPPAYECVSSPIPCI